MRSIHDTDMTTAFRRFGLVANLCMDCMGHDTCEMPARLKPYLVQQPCEAPLCVGRNLIVILAESLSSYPIGRSIDGQPVTPCIDSLVREGAFYTPHMRSQTSLGESSDGQWAYMTGIEPLRNAVTINSAASRETVTFCSLIKRQYPQYRSRMTLPTERGTWNQDYMCRKYGVDTLYAITEHRRYGSGPRNDETLLRYAAEIDAAGHEPFISMVLTLSMHSPYNREYEQWDVRRPAGYSPELFCYMKAAHYTDRWIGWYVRQLRATGLYDRSVIVICADHRPKESMICMPANPGVCDEIPLLIAGGVAVREHVVPQPRYGQTDLFPTILDMWGIRGGWRGVGQSLFMPGERRGEARERKRQDMAGEISRYLIESDYFNRSQKR